MKYYMSMHIVMDRDHNEARNILLRAMATITWREVEDNARVVAQVNDINS